MLRFRLEPADPEYDDRFRVLYARRPRSKGVPCGEVARDEEGRWMAFVPGWPNGVPGFRTASGAARWLAFRHEGDDRPPPGYGPKAPLLERRKRRRWKSDQAKAVIRKRRWRRRKRWDRLAAEAERADPRLRPEEGLRWALAVTAAAAMACPYCTFDRDDGRVALVRLTRDEVRAARAWLSW